MNIILISILTIITVAGIATIIKCVLEIGKVIESL